MERYAHDPYGFCTEILQRDWDTWQEEEIRALVNPDGSRIKRQAEAAAHGVGKSWKAAGVGLWRTTCLPQSQNIMTSATFPQLSTRLWPTVVRLKEGSMISEFFEETKDSLRIPGTENWLKAQAWNRSNSESFAGLHVRSPGLLVDESSGVWEEIFNAFEGSMQHENSYMLALGNPLYRKGKLFDAFHKERALWRLRSISGYDSSYVDRQWLEDMKELHGEDSDVFKVRCLGLFPAQDIESWISEDMVLGAFERKVERDVSDFARNAAIDVAFFRDRCTFGYVQGPYKKFEYTWRGVRDPQDLIYDLCHLIEEHEIDKLAVDILGPGYPIATGVAKKFPDKVVGIKYSEAAYNEKMYANLRAEAWGRIKDYLQYCQFLCGSMSEWVDDITAPTYSYDGKGRYLMESKEAMRARGIPSTDKADELGMSLLLPEKKEVKRKPRRYKHAAPRGGWMGS